MSEPDTSGSHDVEAYLAAAAQPQQDTLRTLRATLRRVLPFADEGMKYAMPSVILHGHGVAAYAAFKDHCSYFPFSSGVPAAAGDLPGVTSRSKGALQFAPDKPLPISTVRRLVKLRLAELSEVQNGKRYDYYPDGRVKAEGSMKAGLLNGRWRWYRSDGTLLRTGQFRAGVQSGTWQTWDRDGQLVKATTY